jgi:hypothetical protein
METHTTTESEDASCFRCVGLNNPSTSLEMVLNVVYEVGLAGASETHVSHETHVLGTFSLA